MIATVDVVLFDFFGTLVDYEPDRTRLAYPRSHDLVRGWDDSLTHDDFLARWDVSSAGLEEETRASMREFTMAEAAAAFAASCGLGMTDGHCAELGAAFVAEWEEHVVPVPGVIEMVHRLRGSTRLGLVSNTHDRHMVPSMLEAMGHADSFELVLLSVDHGHRKPHPSIYREALDRLGCDAGSVAFVGDSCEADYAGPRRAGMEAFLIDPSGRHDVPSSARLSTVLDIEAHLLA